MQAWGDIEGEQVLVLGGPGTGKTSALVAATARRLTTGRSAPLVLMGSRQAASEFRDRVSLSTERAMLAPPVMTVHAFCLGLLQRAADEHDVPLRLLTAPEQEFRIREVLAGWGQDRWPAALHAALPTSGFARQVRAVLARARHLGLDPDDLVARGEAAAEPAWVVLGHFFEEYLAVLDLEGVLDYAELVHRSRLALAEEWPREGVRAEFGPVYVDAWAELDPAQLALVAQLVGPGGTLVACADPDTAIYRFRGAHPRPVAAFQSLFPQGVVRVLDREYRSGAALVSALAGVRGRLGAPTTSAELTSRYRHPQVSPPGGGDAAGAAVQVWQFATPAQEARGIAAELRAAHLQHGWAWADMAVLVRAGRSHIPPLARALVDAGIPVEVAGDEIGLASELAVRPLLLALEVAARGGEPDADETTRLLTSGWGGLDAVALRRLGRWAKGSTEGAGTAADTLARALGGGELPDAWPDVVGDEVAVLASRAALLQEAVGAVAAGRRPDEVLWGLWSGVPWGADLRAAALRGGEAGRRAHRSLDAVVALFELAAQSSAGGGQAGVRAFLAEVAAQQIPADIEREAAVRGRGVRLLTAHRAAGRTWPFVVVAGVQEGVWPDVRRRGSLFDPESLRGEQIGPGVETRDLVASERRLFVLACSRATRRLLVTVVAGTEGEADQPSRFVAELGVAPELRGAPEERLLTLRSLVSALRRAAEDPEASPGVRHAAATRLARLAHTRDDAGRSLAPEADPTRWWGVASVTRHANAAPLTRFTLSPSQLTSLLACPRKYFLEREARAEPPRPGAAVLGTVIHTLAEYAAREGLTADEASGRLDEVWPHIPFTAAWLSASERAEAESAVARLLAWQDAHASADVVGVEVPFEVEVEVGAGVLTVRGSVDRLERLPSGELRVIDFKSSRRLPTKQAVESHEQVGVYQLAADLGAFDDVAPGARGSSGGELVFLREGDVLPKVLGQPSLRERPHLSDDPGEAAHPTWVHHRLASAADTLASRSWHATPGEHCTFCPFKGSCPATSSQVIS